ncbi:MAG: TRAM domain-containing protein, partial [Pseudomonadota bacterium]
PGGVLHLDIIPRTGAAIWRTADGLYLVDAHGVEFAELSGRAARPDLLLSGDFIVGFPGETDADFEDTMALVEEVSYGQAYSFKYSARPGTPAAEKQDVDGDVADARLQRLQALLTTQQKEAQDGMIGSLVQVLFEKSGKRSGQLVGKSDYLHSVHVDAPEGLRGEIAPVRITGSASNSLAGVLAEAE